MTKKMSDAKKPPVIGRLFKRLGGENQPRLLRKRARDNTEIIARAACWPALRSHFTFLFNRHSARAESDWSVSTRRR